MNHATPLVGILLTFGIPLAAILTSTAVVYAQQLSSSSSSPAAGDDNQLAISSELKAKMCDPSNPTLKVVNTTESNICGIPKTVKPPSLSAAMPPPTSAVSSSSSPPPQQTTTTTKPTTTAGSVVDLPKQQQQQQIATTSNDTAISQSTGGATGATIATVSNPSNSSLSSSPSAIAPQVNAISQQQQQQPQPVTGINNTAGQNYTFTTTSQPTASGKLTYLGYHGGGDDTPTTDGDSILKHKVDTKPSTDHSKSSTSTPSSSKDK
ncbi:MAG: hypothetical protein ACJ72R_16240, partial [Nitrososphaeraceae archaeon]